MSSPVYSWLPLIFSLLEAKAYKHARYVPAGSWCKIDRLEAPRKEVAPEVVEAYLTNFDGKKYMASSFVLPSETPEESVKSYHAEYCSKTGRYIISKRNHVDWREEWAGVKQERALKEATHKTRLEQERVLKRAAHEDRLEQERALIKAAHESTTRTKPPQVTSSPPTPETTSYLPDTATGNFRKPPGLQVPSRSAKSPENDEILGGFGKVCGQEPYLLMNLDPTHPCNKANTLKEEVVTTVLEDNRLPFGTGRYVDDKEVFEGSIGIGRSYRSSDASSSTMAGSEDSDHPTDDDLPTSPLTACSSDSNKRSLPHIEKELYYEPYSRLITGLDLPTSQDLSIYTEGRHVELRGHRIRVGSLCLDVPSMCKEIYQRYFANSTLGKLSFTAKTKSPNVVFNVAPLSTRTRPKFLIFTVPEEDLEENSFHGSGSKGKILEASNRQRCFTPTKARLREHETLAPVVFVLEPPSIGPRTRALKYTVPAEEQELESEHEPETARPSLQRKDEHGPMQVSRQISDLSTKDTETCSEDISGFAMQSVLSQKWYLGRNLDFETGGMRVPNLLFGFDIQDQDSSTGLISESNVIHETVPSTSVPVQGITEVFCLPTEPRSPVHSSRDGGSGPNPSKAALVSDMSVPKDAEEGMLSVRKGYLNRLPSIATCLIYCGVALYICYMLIRHIATTMKDAKAPTEKMMALFWSSPWGLLLVLATGTERFLLYMMVLFGFMLIV